MRITTSLARFPLFYVISVGMIYGVFLYILFHFMGEFYWFSPDSWLLLDLGRNIDFASYSTWIDRSYVPETYSAPFPVGMPFLISLIGGSARLVVLFNIFCFFFSYLTFISVIKKLKVEVNLASAIFSIGPFLFFPYVAELLGGRTFPLVVLFVLLALYLLLKCLHSAVATGCKQKSLCCFFAGLLLGFAFSVRTDSIVLTVSLLVFFSSRMAFNYIIFILIGFTLGVAPWLIFSKVLFGTWLSSDNSWVAFGFGQLHSQDFYSRELLGVSHDLSIILNSIADVLISLLVVLFVFNLPLVLFALYYRLSYAGVRSFMNEIGYVSVIYLLALVSLLTVVGYYDYRYFSVFLVFVFVAVAVANGKLELKGTAWCVAFLFCINGSMVIYQYFKKAGLGVYQFECAALYLDENINKGGGYIVDDSNFGSYYAYTREVPVHLLPSNFDRMSADEVLEFERRFVGAIYVDYQVVLKNSGCNIK